MQIDPWGSSQYQDYARLRDEFGIAPFGRDEWSVFSHPHRLFRRGVVFGHRDFERVADAVRGRDPWSVMTGFMPSGDLHMGHKMVLEQVIAHQAQGADVHLAVADFEAIAARGFTLDRARTIAMDQYVHNALALGLKPDNAEFYFQTRRHRVNTLANRFAQKVNWSVLQSLYGFTGSTSIAHVLAPLVQAADILHSQQDGAGPRPILVPVGVDQDPHVRLARDIAQDWRVFNVAYVEKPGDAAAGNPAASATSRGSPAELGVYVKTDVDVKAWLDVAEATLRSEGYGETRRNDPYKAIYVRGTGRNDVRRIDQALARAEAQRARQADGGANAAAPAAFVRPSATFHRFMTGLQGGKMSSSRPETSIYLTEDPKSAEKKLRASVTGGRATAEEQRRLGANPDVCPVYELYLYHLAEDDEHLQEVHDTCKSGARLCGGCKSEAAGLLLSFLRSHKEKRDETAHLVEQIVAKD